MNRKIINLAATFGTILTTLGCATIMTGGQQQVAFDSQPPGARILVDGTEHGRTPDVVELERDSPHSVVIDLEGYAPYSLTLERGVNGWVWGNLLLGGLIGLVVDASTGALYKLTPEQVETTLAQNAAVTINDDSSELSIVVGLMPAQGGWEKIAQLDRGM